ncbi:MAG: insulinase family protein [Streptococcaceae bacterium]|nr:insulinase family protein [Streptococcaceae bacterium]
MNRRGIVESFSEEIIFKELKNGLKVSLVPKKDYYNTFGIFTTNYGSMDNQFVPIGGGEEIQVPDGIAHFLEHKLFESEVGDAMDDFSKIGGNANAFTTSEKTAYLFEATMDIEENVLLLLDFVQHPYFEEKSVEREKGIIAQEIQMYQDDPDWRLYFGLLQNLFPKEAIAIDIAGTVESIQEITPQDLSLCYETFYHPSNMNLTVVGNFDAEELLEKIEANQDALDFLPKSEIQRKPMDITGDVVRENTVEMEVEAPKFSFGQKLAVEMPVEIEKRTRFKLCMSAFTDLLFSSSSSHFESAYLSGVIDDTFSSGVSFERNAVVFSASGDSREPEEAIRLVREAYLNFERSPEFTEEKLESVKKRMLGKFLRSMNSLEFIAINVSSDAFEGTNFLHLPRLIDTLTLEEVLQTAKGFVDEKRCSTFRIQPKGVD